MAIDRVKHNLRHSNAFYIKACENFWFYFSGVFKYFSYLKDKKLAKSE
ncbi:hypothetical protein HPHPH19_0363 [Helicobacter pylori Hp H-19]|nr:hypothetical protein HPHPH19_0363 [Helicobacter pylori Hp H-19]EMH00021.1 hypothetical protein HMPREF1405_00979 [Helicobacter pylori GAM231Ai]